MKINTGNWGKFRVGDLFDIHPTKHYNDENGKALSNSQLLDLDGINPVIVNSSYNNGVGGYTNRECTEKGGIITFSDTTTADAIFYQERDFVGYSHVQGMYAFGEYKDKWTLYSMKFFEAVFHSRANDLGYNYVNKFTRELANDITIFLPIDAIGDPDWQYMENYMKSIETKVCNSLSNLQSTQEMRCIKVDVSTWKNFPIGQLFKVVKGSRLTKANMKEGSIRYIGASSFENGITQYISNAEHIHKGNTLTVCYNGSDIGRTFYQNEPFWATDDVNVLYPKFEINENIALFIAPIIKAVGGTHEYDDKWKKEDMEKENILLPCTTSGAPDFEYMEKYIQNLKSDINKNLDALEMV